MSPAFAPSLGRLVADAAQRPLVELWAEPAELARFALDLAGRTGASHVLFPFDALVVVEAAGAELSWTDDEPGIADARGVDLVDVEPADVAGAVRWAQAIEAARFIASLRPVAGLVPSPGLLAEQAGSPEDADAIESAEDLSAAYARALLECGVQALVVETAAGEVPTTPSGLDRVAELFGVECHWAGPADRHDVVRLGLDGGAAQAIGARIVLSDRALEPGTDLGAVLALSQSLRQGADRC